METVVDMNHLRAVRTDSVPGVVLRQQKADSLLWMVDRYLELIGRKTNLVFGSSMSRLYAMMTGADTLNDQDLVSITEKSMRMGLIPKNLRSFGETCITRNCKIYGNVLLQKIYDRIEDIAAGVVRNPDSTIVVNPDMARRNYYVPPLGFMKRALNISRGSFHMDVAKNLCDLETDALSLLTRMKSSVQHINEEAAAWGALKSVLEILTWTLGYEEYSSNPEAYLKISKPALRILWVIGKFIFADFTDAPKNSQLVAINIAETMRISDGTLAAIPYPTPQTIGIFMEPEGRGLSFRANDYLAATSSIRFF